ncbi:hypothetical protein VF21_02322 [Pseudogymnoascus sp. 05NY08]|nr:hypothetical protein VF21_02322 [Pseudogymnoascus sp. 05NY08]
MASKGSFNSAIPEEASVGQAQDDSPPGQSNGANKDPMEPGVSPPGSLVPALSAHSFEKKEEPRLSRRYTGIMHFFCTRCGCDASTNTPGRHASHMDAPLSERLIDRRGA